MAITSSGYDGTVDEVQWAKLVPAVGAGQYGVVGAGDWLVTAHPTTDKAVNVAPGSGWGPGIYDTSDATVAVQCAALASGTRWDLITVKRDWQPPNGATVFSKITGGAVKALPARLNTPGQQDEQPLALVQWTAGQTQPTAIVDLRCWAGNGGMFAKDDLARTYLERLGTCVKIGGARWSYELLTNDVPGWVNEDGSGPWSNLTLRSGWTNNGASIARIRTVGRGAFIHVQADVRYGSGSLAEGAVISDLPVGMRPLYQGYIPGSTNTYRSGAFYVAGPGGLTVGPFPVGTICQLNGLAALK